jgi:hypothetical protein
VMTLKYVTVFRLVQLEKISFSIGKSDKFSKICFLTGFYSNKNN